MDVHSLTADDIAALTAFLADPDRPEGTLSFHALQGFLFTIASAPELVPPSQWLPLICNGEDPGYSSFEQAQATLGRIMALYNDVIALVSNGHDPLPAGCEFRTDILANFDDDAPIANWSRGFALAHQWLESSWDSCVFDELDDELGAIVLILSFFSSRSFAEAYVAECNTSDAPEPPHSLKEAAAILRKMFPQAVLGYAHFGEMTRAARFAADAEPRQPVRRTKIGRNAPCPCGSGRKYKKCCGIHAR